VSKSATSAVVDDTDRLLAFGLGFAGLGLIGISMFLPVWDEGSVSAFSSISENTLLQSGNGWITLIFAGLSAISLVRALRNPRRVWWPLLWGVVIVGYAVYLGVDEDSRTLCPLTATTITDACQVAEPGIGVYVLGLGGAALVGAGLFFLRFPKMESKAAVAGDPMKMTRECPHCKSDIRPDASVCPHCQRESTPWTLHGGQWWRQEPDGAWYWYEVRQPDVGWHLYDGQTDPKKES
jgi:hypothetical protein